MTIEFTIDQWQELAPGVYIILLQTNETLETPLMQAFRYLDPEAKTVMGLITPNMLNYTSMNNTIIMQSHEPFAGYIAIR